MRPIREIIVHCSATRPEWMALSSTSQKVMEIRRWHVQDRGWNDIGYHLLIDRDGTVAKGRPMEKVGAHVAGYNTGTVGVCLIGGHGSAETDRFADHFTPAQDAALRKVLADLRAQFPTIAKISGHNEYAQKACPGFKVGPWWHSKAALAPKPVADSRAPDPAVNRYGDPRSDWLAWLMAAIAKLFRK